MYLYVSVCFTCAAFINLVDRVLGGGHTLGECSLHRPSNRRLLFSIVTRQRGGNDDRTGEFGRGKSMNRISTYSFDAKTASTGAANILHHPQVDATPKD